MCARTNTLAATTHHARGRSPRLCRVARQLFESELLPTLLRGCEDRVPNVRLAAATALGRVGRVPAPALVDGSIKPALSRLSSDSDRDVQYYAQEAIAAISA